jgi:acetyl-CoA acetyltransferase
MTRPLSTLRPVYVVGIGLHPYQRPSDGTYVELGLRAVREALADAGISWKAVESAYVGNAILGMAPGRPMLRHLGATGLSITHVENASATGSSAVRQACLEVASGIQDVALALGVDKIGPGLMNLSPDGTEPLADLLPVDHFALLTRDYMNRHRISAEDVAGVAVKNHGNGARNPCAHYRKMRTLEEVMSGPISGALTRLQCCPLGEGAAAVLLASEEGMNRLGINRSRAVRVAASVSGSERVYAPAKSVIVELTRETARQAFDEASIGPGDLDVLELHDAFAVEELLYTEAIGLCGEGQGAAYLVKGRSAIGGECAVSPSGGLLAMGHPFGPTGVGQIVEITRQLRGEAGPRQQPNARLGMAHMVGLGQVCLIHILQGPHAA